MGQVPGERLCWSENHGGSFDYFIVGRIGRGRSLATTDFKNNFDIAGYRYRFIPLSGVHLLLLFPNITNSPS
jgi:hypothetical protein